MTYIKQNFEDGQVLKAEHLNYMEDGIADHVHSWEDLENKPFGDGEIVFFEGDNLEPEYVDGGYIFNEVFSGDFNDALQYTVLLDGVEYTCDVFDVYGMSTAIGNPAILGAGEDNGLPFISGVGLIDLGSLSFICATAFTSLSISYNGVKKLPAEYIAYPVTVFSSWTSLGDVDTWLYPDRANDRKITLPELKAARENGQIIISSKTGHYFTPVEIYVGDSYGSVTFVNCHWDVSTPTYITLYTAEYAQS